MAVSEQVDERYELICAKSGYVTAALSELRNDKELELDKRHPFQWQNMEQAEILEELLLWGRFWRRLYKITSVETAKEQLLDIASGREVR